LGELAAALNESGIGIEQSPVAPEQLAQLIARVTDGTINNKTAKDVFAALWAREEASADAIIEARGLTQISDARALEKIVDEVLAANPRSVDEYRAGKNKAFNALVGQAMKATKGKANPQQLNEILRRRLAG
jgi:aspartyl-tRNA(Asn)/glutamyl-tRNA(Gln) amidotransferase subunit B